MNKTIRLFTASFLIMALISCSKTTINTPSSTATIIYSGNLDGELEPCGCSATGDLGGILRRASKVAELREQEPELFLISSGGLLANASPRDRLKSEYILKGMAAMDYDAFGLQWRDLSYGVEFLNTTPLPWVASNWSEEGVFPAQHNIKHGNTRLAFFTWLDPDNSPFRQMKGNHQTVSGSVEQLQKAVLEAKQQGALVVLTSALALEQINQLFILDNIDVLIIKSAYEEYGEPKQDGKTLVLQPGSRGMRLGQVDLVIDHKGDINSWKHKIIPLPEDIPNAPALKTWYDEYNARVKTAYLADVERRKLQQSGQSPYAGSESCQSCHEKAYKIWSDSLHARAFERLEDVGKSFDPDCIVCHTAGFNQPGGYIDTRLTMHLTNVQCESCHGASQSHVDSRGEKPTRHDKWSKEKICNQCHTQPHSPEFSIASYWTRIAHH